VRSCRVANSWNTGILCWDDSILLRNIWQLGLWSSFWPLEMISLGLAFFYMAFWMRQFWLVIPAIVIGLNGLLLFFFAATGLWPPWKILWILEPFFIGLPLRVIGQKTQVPTSRDDWRKSFHFLCIRFDSNFPNYVP